MQPRQTDSGRVACPQCRANNFQGQARCWQCNALLAQQANARMPQASVSRPMQTPQRGTAPVMPGQGAAFAPRMPSRAGIAVLCIGVALLAFWVVFRVGSGHQESLTATPKSPLPPMATMNPQSASSEATPNPQATPESSDPLMSEAQRVLARERRNLDLAPPPNAAKDANGRIRLRSGGSISPEEWEAARRKVQQSPVANEPPAPPPF